MLRTYLNLAYLMFKYLNLDLNGKNNLYQIFTICYTEISAKIENTYKLLKFGT